MWELLVDKKAPGHAGDSCEGDEEKNDRKIRRMFFRLRARPAEREGQKTAAIPQQIPSKQAMQKNIL